MPTELEYVKSLLKRIRDNCVEPWEEASFCDVRAEIDHYFIGMPDAIFVQAPKPASETTAPADVQDAAYKFRETLVPRADHMTADKFPMWHGWAIYEAFLEGARYARSATRASIWVIQFHDKSVWHHLYESRIAAQRALANEGADFKEGATVVGAILVAPSDRGDEK